MGGATGRTSSNPRNRIIIAAVLLALIPALVFIFREASSRGDHSVGQRQVTTPNFLLIISDDQSWQHTSFANYPLVSTPNFDRIANEGVYFSNSYASAPTCTGSRSALLAGQPVWRLGSSAMLFSYYSEQMISYQDILERSGYSVGYSGKGWDPGRVPKSRLGHRPAGEKFNQIKREVESHLGSHDLAANFEAFLDQAPAAQPFSFWAGSTEPHRPYKHGENRFKAPAAARHIPASLPNTPRVQADLSSYLDEIEVFDRDVGRLLAILEDRKLLDNTVVIVTSDNGMPFSRAKTNNYTLGVRIPLAVRWGAISASGRVVQDFVNLTDIAPTLLRLAGVEIPEPMIGKDFLYALQSNQSGFIDVDRNVAYSAYERHAGYVRGGRENLTYPRRAIHSEDYVYIRNYFPQRWPSGDPPGYRESYPFLLMDPVSKKPLQPQHALATQKRPREELYDLKADPDQLVNVAMEPDYQGIKAELSSRLTRELERTGDPVQLTGEDVFAEFEYLQPYSK